MLAVPSVRTSLILALSATLSLLVASFPVAENHPSFNNVCQSKATMATSRFRAVQRVLPAPPAHWVGDGFRVYPVFADLMFQEALSPLLMFDYAAPKTFPPNHGKPLGVGQHPHRGFQTVTIAFQGEVEHQDSTGKKGVIQAGDVQWMTAGRGIIHQEYHSKEFSARGGVFEMCQLWVNLPKKYKMTPPRYQPILNSQIPVVNLPLDQKMEGGENLSLGSARIIAGQLGSTKGAAETFSPVQMWDVSLPHAGSEVDLPYPPDHTCIVFVRRGSVEVLSSGEANDSLVANKLGPQDVALLQNGNDGSDHVKIRVLEADSSVIIMGGEPLNEPIAAQGPFVMNDQTELYQAMQDYRSGKFGR